MPIPTQLIKQRKAFLRKAKLTKIEKLDCTVIAYAIVTGISYAEAHDALRRAGRRHGEGFWLQHPSNLNKLLREQNCKAVEIGLHSVKGKTTKTIDLPRDHRYLVFVRSHVLAVQFGLVKDWSYKRNLRIQEVYRIERNEENK